jgi:hypothetical protein
LPPIEAALTAETLPASRRPHPADLLTAPAIIADDSDSAARRLLEFFTANIENPNTHPGIPDEPPRSPDARTGCLGGGRVRERRPETLAVGRTGLRGLPPWR